MSHVFISYSKKNRVYARTLANHLIEQGFDVWIDDRIAFGADWWRTIVRAIRGASAFIVIMTKDSDDSEWVQREVTIAVNYSIPQFPFWLSGDFHTSENWSIYVRTQYADVRDGNLPEENFYELLSKKAPRKTRPGDQITPQSIEALSINADAELAVEIANPPAPQATQLGTGNKAYTEFHVVVAKVGAADFRSLGDALNQVIEGTTILVKPGLYCDSLTLNKSVVIVGDGERERIILESSIDNCIQMDTDYAEIRGLTIRLRTDDQSLQKFAVGIPKGQLILEDCDISSDSASCVAIHGKQADPILRRCKIHDGKHAGVIVSRNATTVIEDCDIFANATGGVIINSNANLKGSACRIINNSQYGITVLDNGSCDIENSDLRGNMRGAWSIQVGCKVEQRNNQEW